jgi:hypothetical protein
LKHENERHREADGTCLPRVPVHAPHTRSRHVVDVTAKTVCETVTRADHKSYFMTDEAPVYERLGRESPVAARYLGEFDFRYNERIALGVDDTERAKKAIEGR